MKAYFASFNGFVRDPNASFAREFNRLATFRNWNPKSKSRKWQKERAKAVEAEFSAYYDTSVTSLESWQKLCDKTSVGPVPTSIVECKKVSTSGTSLA